MEEFIESYGLIALFIGMLIEGELLFLTGMVLAKMGHFSLSGAVIAVYFGAVGHDIGFYTLGRLQGQLFFKKRPRLEKKLNTLLQPFHKNPTFYYTTYRFLIGFRMIFLALFGISGVKPVKLILIVLWANLLWVAFYAFVGYYFAEIVITYMEWIEQYKGWIFLVIALLIGGLIWKRRAPL